MDTIVPPQDFYVYILNRPAKPDTSPDIINPDGTVPFYVGKGSNGRITNHEACARRNEACRHITCRVIRKVWREGGEISREKVIEQLSEEEAFNQEKSLIAYGRQMGWPLKNLTDGGEGASGYKTDPAQVEKHRQQMKVMFSTPERIEHQRQISLHYWETHPEEALQYRLKMADPVARAKAGEANIGNVYNAKTYSEGFQSPIGEIFTGITHLKAFCTEHNLNSVHMYDVYSGERISHKGWTRYPPLPRETKPTYAKAGFKSPTGEIYEADSIPSLITFCRQYGLQR